MLPPVPLPPVGQEIVPMEGIRMWRNPLNGFLVVRTHYTADPNRRGQWRLQAAPKYGGLRSWRWRKEQEIDWEAASGKLVFEMWDEAVHQIEPFVIPEHWPKWVLWDPGWRNPNAVNWVAIDVDAEPNGLGHLPLHFYREFYKPEHSPEQVARIVHAGSGLGDRDAREEWVEEVIVDPMAKQEHQSAASPESTNQPAQTVLGRFMDELERLGWDVPVDGGNNDKSNAIEELVMRVGRYWVDAEGIPLVDEDDNYREAEMDEILDGARPIEPTIFFHHTCVAGPREMAGYRWADWASAQVAEKHNEQEKPLDKDDHVVTNVIRFVNRLQEYRDSTGIDLTAFDERPKPHEWTPLDEAIEERHRTRAGRYRKRLRERSQ